VLAFKLRIRVLQITLGKPELRYFFLFVTQNVVDPMLAEIFMLRLEANTRPPRGEPIPVSARFVPFKPEIRFELKSRSPK
jgi:hypothetical protein